MAANVFINNFENLAEKLDFDFKKFNDEHLIQFSPAKTKIDYLNQEERTSFKFRDAIISNLGLNPYFVKDNHNNKIFDYLYGLLKDTEDGVKTQDQLAQLTLLLHFSKSLLEKKSTWDFFFQIFPSLTIVNNPEFDFKPDLVNLFDRIKSSERITQGINFNFEALTLKLYNFADYRLNGFAGIHNVFIGLKSIERFLRDLPAKFDYKQRLEIFRLNMTRLIINEICHVVLRRALNNFDASSPTVSTSGPSSIQQSQSTLIEAGIVAEMKIFSKRVDWNISVMSPYLNLAYCTDFLNQLIDLPVTDQYPADIPSFDFETSGCVENTNKICYMSIDFEEEMDFFLN
ncbi:unnamed protein product [Brachionus calyciflorus]|uniref:Uncharacterized protein n=1 Tax=Brachionus calyciflorus TaxID=104777 RepID=A0A814DAU2_9BILA|nr:unnamed protein product [Brachionus calyciflorus]